jgi:hypothetical protein
VRSPGRGRTIAKPRAHFSRRALMAVFIALPWFLLGGLGYCAALVARSIGGI